VKQLEIGVLLEGRYRLREHVVRRGLALVFIADDVVTGQELEAHVVPADAPHELRVRFSDAMELAAGLDHPHIAHVASAGALPDGTLYGIVLDPPTSRLDARLQARLPAHAVASIGAQLLNALIHMHQRGVGLASLALGNIGVCTESAPLSVRLVEFPFVHRDASERGTDLQTLGNLLCELATGIPAGALDLKSWGRTMGHGEVELRLRSIIDTLTTRPHSADPSALLAQLNAFKTVAPVPLRRSIPELDSVRRFTPLPPSEDFPGSTNSGVMMQTSIPAPELRSTPPRRSLAMIGSAAAAFVLAGVSILVSTSDSMKPPVAASTDVAAVGTPTMRAAVDDATTPAPPAIEDTLTPIQSLAAVNEPDLARVLPFARRHALLARLSARTDLRSRIDDRWNAVLDLVQAPQATEPCEVFAAAWHSLASEPPTGRERGALRGLTIPDGSACDRISDDVHNWLGVSSQPAARQRRAARKRVSSERNPSARSEAVESTRPMSSVAAPLHDDIKGVHF
jgi:hypothetical protein